MGALSPMGALAYMRLRFVPNYSIISRVLREVDERCYQDEEDPDAALRPRPKAVLDFGCGPGSGLAAARAVWPDLQRCVVSPLMTVRGQLLTVLP
jgi:ribosomal protein RSM22 (predicted rRNA methylase)